MTEISERAWYPYQPDHAVPPGETLLEILEARGMKQAELATRTGLSPKHINQIIKGLAPITPETALGLEKVTEIPARTWNAMEATYRSLRSRKEEEDELRSEADWLKELPIKELASRGYIQLSRSVVDQVREVCRFFGVANRAAWEALWKPTAYRKSRVFESDPGAISTWLRIGEIEASRIECEPFNRKRLEAALQEARSLTLGGHPRVWLPQVQQSLAGVGVALVVVREIGKTRVLGASRWLSSSKGLIQLSVRQKWADIFWFTLFHEAGHLLRHGKKQTFINMDETSREELEKDADTFAARWLIPREHDQTLSRLTVSEASFFAGELGIGADIVIGRLQHEGAIRPDQGRHLQRLLDPQELEEISRQRSSST